MLKVIIYKYSCSTDSFLNSLIGTVTVGCRARLRGCVKTQLDVGCPLDVSQFQELIDEINKVILYRPPVQIMCVYSL